jgi:bifunctional DNA-binding transcriptional regulator/antitoxin component of YhaV-PrlF toxin-antitoxin module
VNAETIVSSEGTITIPDAVRRELGISTGAVIAWSVEEGKLVGIKQSEVRPLNAVQQHIRKYSGSWKGVAKVLEKTRPAL